MPKKRYARIVDLSEKAASLLFTIIQRPSLIPRLLKGCLRGAHPNELIHLGVPWLTDRGIKTIIDVGANKGQFSAAAGFLMPDARLYALEPLPDCYETLQKRLGNTKRFTAFNVAAGDKNGEETIWRSSFAKSSSLLPMGETHKNNFPWTAETTAQKITVSRLDDLFEDLTITPPVLLKIDVQGYEDKVLAGAARVLGKTDIIIIEMSFSPLYEGQALFADIFRLLSESGFEFRGVLAQRASPQDGSILQADALFARKSVH